ncbi:hypothetical protein Bcep1808_7448 (plasmid) [Burkholderia vietnamiensis G4]|uniref:Uncharacterized protein n=2 Tax=Burkholderia cepacia complex TaxID=87882 RepID=A4JVM2_BURVG|nr:hypothetical protein Bcep1808_7448 [Burkholderia vietnamiensis G4]
MSIAMPKDASSLACAFKVKLRCRMNDRMTIPQEIDDDVACGHEVVVSAAGDTVWVNGGDGSCVGRFSKRFGIDVHRTVAEMLAGADQCLFCTHEPADAAAWATFRADMAKHHGVVVPERLITFST